MCFHCRHRSPSRSTPSPSTPVVPISRTSPAASPPYTVQFVVGSVESPESFPRLSVYMPSALASTSPYLRRRIQPPNDGGQIAQVVLVDAYYDGLALYKYWLQHGVVPKFRRSSFTAVPTSENTLLWSECFDLIRAHILGSRFDHLEFSDHVMAELIRWLDPAQEADMEVLDFVFSERGVSEALQRFVVDRMFADEKHVRTIFKLFLDRKRKGRLGKFRMARSYEYHTRHDVLPRALSDTSDEDERSQYSRENKSARPSSVPLSKKRLGGSFTSIPPLKPYRNTRHAQHEFPYELGQRSFASMREPQSTSPILEQPTFQYPIPFPPAPYLASASNDALVRKHDLRRKPLPRSARSLVDNTKGVSRQSSWPILKLEDATRIKNSQERGRRGSLEGRLLPKRLIELGGRSVTPEELWRPTRPGSAP